MFSSQLLVLDGVGRITISEAAFLILLNPIIFLFLREERDRRDLGQ